MLRFKCPVCGCTHALERVQCDGVVSEIEAIYEGGELEYGECQADGDVVNVRYECRDCNFCVPDVSNQEEFTEWCEENC